MPAVKIKKGTTHGRVRPRPRMDLGPVVLLSVRINSRNFPRELSLSRRARQSSNGSSLLSDRALTRVRCGLQGGLVGRRSGRVRWREVEGGLLDVVCAMVVVEDERLGRLDLRALHRG